MFRNKGLYDFIVDLGHRESSSNYEAENKYKYIGRYQFGKARLYDLGISLDGWHPKDQPPKRIISTAEFKKDTLLQDLVMVKHIRDLKYQIMKRPEDYKLGEKINGIEISLSGCIASAHLKGIGGLREFVSGKDNVDGFGTSVSSYMKQFGGYSLVE